MPVIVGTLSNSADRPIPKARLTITLTSGIVDLTDTPDTTLLPVPVSFILTNGALATAQMVRTDGTLDTAAPINLLASESFGVPYQFRLEAGRDIIRFYRQTGELYSAVNDPDVLNPAPWFLHTDSKYYTGSEFISGVSALLTRIVTTDYYLVDDFFAMISGTADVEYSLLRKTGLASRLDDSVYLIAETLTTDPTYLSRLSGRITIRGQYNPSTFYAQNDVVVSGSVLSVYINASSTAGNIPPNSIASPDTAFWSKLPNLVVSPTQENDLAEYARLGTSTAGVNQTFFGVQTISATGSLIVPPRTQGDNTTNAASTAFVQAEVNHRLPDPILVARAATHPAITVGVNNLSFTQELTDTLNAYNGSDFVVPAGGGDFEFEITVGVSWSGSISSSGDNRVITRIYLFNFTTTTELGEFWRLNENMAAGTIVNRFTGRRRVASLTAGHVIVPRLQLTAPTGGTINAQSIETASGAANNELRIWRA